MPRLDRFSVDDLVTCSQAFRGIGAAATSMEEVAQAVTDYLHHHLVDEDGEPAVPLVRLYKTHRYGDLTPDLQGFARDVAVGEVEDGTRCLTLLGSSGVEPGWKDRRSSQGHRAIPLTSAEVVAKSPMIASLISGLGIDVATVLAPNARDALSLHHRHYDLFFVPDAKGSPMVPAQDGFVEPYGIRSVVGCGGMLPSGDMFALILFTSVALSDERADLFRTLALSVKATLVRLTFDVFADGST